MLYLSVLNCASMASSYLPQAFPNISAEQNISSFIHGIQISNAQSISLLAGLFFFALIVRHSYASIRKLPLPPGPKGLPLIGNLLQFPAGHHWLYYKEIAKKYGPIAHLKLGNDHLVILSKPEDAHELFVKRGANYSSRKNNIYYSDYQSNKLRSGLLVQCPEQKKQRKAMMQMLFPNQIGIYKEWHTLEARRICMALLANSEDFVNLFRKLTMNAASWAAYGQPGNDAKLKKLVQIAQDEVYHMTPGAHLVDMFPALDMLPDFLSPWRVKAKADFEDESKVVYHGCMQETQIKWRRGEARECLTTKLLERQEELEISDLDIAYILGQTFEGGTETTAAVFHVFIHAMILHPHVQKRAQEEIDRVVGDGRSPTFDDDLPYIRCCTKELLRWRTVEPTGFPHTNDWEDGYKGYRIPKGTLVFPVTYNMHTDESVYPDSDVFNPARYRDDKSAMTEGHYTFGFGRRDCPGMHLATQLVYIVVAHLLAHYTFGYAVDASTGKEIPIPNYDYTALAIGSQPKPFKCRIRVRDAAHASIIRKEWREYEDQGKV